MSGGITELDPTKHKELAEAWSDSGILVARSSWRKSLYADGPLHCPEDLRTPWLFSMDPMSYSESGDRDDDKLYLSDRDRLENVLQGYFESGQPGIACLFVYGMGTQNSNPQRQFWAFLDRLADFLNAETGSYWVIHRGGNRNLAGLLFSNKELAWGFTPPGVRPGRGLQERDHLKRKSISNGGASMQRSASVMTKPEQIHHIVHTQLPCGKVVTYGDISQQVYGHCKAGQAVGGIIKAHEDNDGFPWWRVVDRTWCPKRPSQKEHLLSEKVTFDLRGRVMSQHRFDLRQP